MENQFLADCRCVRLRHATPDMDYSGQATGSKVRLRHRPAGRAGAMKLRRKAVCGYTDFLPGSAQS